MIEASRYEEIKRTVERDLDEKIKRSEEVKAHVQAIASLKSHITVALKDAGHEHTAKFIESEINDLVTRILMAKP